MTTLTLIQIQIFYEREMGNKIRILIRENLDKVFYSLEKKSKFNPFINVGGNTILVMVINEIKNLTLSYFDE